MAACVRDSALLHVRASLLNSRTGQQQQQDVTEAVLSRVEGLGVKLSKEQRQAAVAGPLTSHGEAAVLQRIKYRLDRSGYQWPEVTVTWQDLAVSRKAVPGDASIPSLLTPFTKLLRQQQRTTLTAVQPTSGVLRPGSMTLLLGPAGSGRSTLLKALCGQLTDSKMVTTQGLGDIRYNGQTHDSFVVQRTATYVDQVDSLFPTLTCRETLNFAEVCCGQSGALADAVVSMMSWEETHPGAVDRCHLDDEADKLLVRMLQGSNLLTSEWALTTLGLQHARDTLVGDALLRGVSGGEKRRVTVGEGLVSPSMVLMLDEATTGLDSASTLALVSSMAAWAKLLNCTVVMACQQPEPAVTAHFDDIILMSEGYTVWQGPAADIMGHFRGLGFEPLPGQDLAEFLQQVASPHEQASLLQGSSSGSNGSDGCGSSGVKSAAELSAAFWASQQGQQIKATARAEFTPTPAQLSSLIRQDMTPPWTDLLAACTKRLLKMDFARNWEACVMRWSLAVLIALVMGLLFYQLPVSFQGGVNFLGMIFQGLFFLQLLCLPTIEMTFEKRPILFRQRDALYYQAWVEWLPAVLLNVPILVVDVLLYGTIIYAMIGFTLTASAYFTFELILLCFSLVVDNLCRVYGSAAKMLNIALGVGVCQALINEMLAGFIMTPSSIPSYWYWAYWVNPFAYAFRALAVNEFKQQRWAVPLASSSSGSSTTTLGDAVLDMFQVQHEGGWIWNGVGVLLGMSGFCAAVALLAYTYNKLAESPAVQPQQQQQQQQGTKGQKGRKQEQGVVIELPAKAILADTPAASTAPDAAAAADMPPVSAAAAAAAEGGLHLTFKGVCYYVPDPAGGRGSELQLLHDISGAFRPGVLTALMGGSGAGKTTLMDVIAGRKTAGRVTGDIRVTGLQLKQSHFQGLIGYCEQADIHSPLATVREALAFSASLRLKTQTGASSPSRAVAVAAAVDEVLQLVDLEHLAGRLVGTPGVDGLSMEQRKRLTIAVELVTFPRILFLDEPTSGLDGSGALLVAGVMRAVADRGVAVVSTIHQPSAAIFGTFDELLLLQRRGRVVYNGPVGRDGECLVQYLRSAVPMAPAFVQGESNPASWMFEVLMASSSSTNKDNSQLDLPALYANSSQAQAVMKQVDLLSQPPHTPSSPSTSPAGLPQHLSGAAAVGPVGQLSALLERGFRSYWRNPTTNLSRFLVTLAMGLIVGSIEWGKGNTSKIHAARDVQNVLGGVYILASALAVEIGFECQSGLARERPVYYRERAAGAYGAGAFLLAQTFVEVVYISVQVLAYTLMTFFMMQLQPTAGMFFYVLLLIWMSCMVQFTTAQALVHITRAAYLATTLLSVLSTLQGFVGGFTRPMPATPVAWWPAFFLSPSFYTFIAIGTRVLGSSSATIPDPSGSSGSTVAVRDYVRVLYNMGDSVFPGAWGSLACLAALTAVMLTLSFVGLRFGKFNRR